MGLSVLVTLSVSGTAVAAEREQRAFKWGPDEFEALDDFELTTNRPLGLRDGIGGVFRAGAVATDEAQARRWWSDKLPVCRLTGEAQQLQLPAQAGFAFGGSNGSLLEFTNFSDGITVLQCKNIKLGAEAASLREAFSFAFTLKMPDWRPVLPAKSGSAFDKLLVAQHSTADRAKECAAAAPGEAAHCVRLENRTKSPLRVTLEATFYALQSEHIQDDTTGTFVFGSWTDKLTVDLPTGTPRVLVEVLAAGPEPLGKVTAHTATWRIVDVSRVEAANSKRAH